MKEAKCLNCKLKFCYKLGTATGKYCSNACQMLFQTKQIYARIKEAGCRPDGVGEQMMRKYLIASRGHKCVICKLEQWRSQPIPVVMDHIDGNAENWNLKNLRLICCNCDAQTPTYKAKNRGNGRHTRRQRYAEGKSF